jgi:hypothetical protein
MPSIVQMQRKSIATLINEAITQSAEDHIKTTEDEVKNNDEENLAFNQRDSIQDDIK